MSFKNHQKQSYIIDTANAFTNRKISKRDFLRRMGMAGVGFSAFSAGMLGRPRRGFFGTPAAATTPEDMANFLREAGKPYAGTTIRYTSEATPPTVVANELKGEFTELTGINVEIEIVPLEQVLAKATQDVQGQLGTYDLYYLDQAWHATFYPDTVDPVEYYNEKPDLAMPDFDFDDFSTPLVEGISKIEDKWVGIPFDIPIFTFMYRRDILENHGIPVPKTYEEFTAAVELITEAEKENGIYGTGLQAKSGHYSLECDWSQAVWGHGGSIFRADGTFSGNDEQGVMGLEWYQNLIANAPAASLESTWDGQFQMMQSGQVAMVQSWDEFFPGLDADDSKVQGLWETTIPLMGPHSLRDRNDAGFGEIPDWGHQGGSSIALSRYSKNIDASWLFLQWVCSKETMVRLTLGGGFAPMRNSSFADQRVLDKAVVGPGTTRHLPVVLETIENHIASEPDMPLWAGLSSNEIPTELGKLLTGQDYNGSAKACMDQVASLVDTAVLDAGLR
ncbi:MAG: extracellular solute-binding protein [Roseovarius sp.]|nr:extracellular solute-binding protein [Roseovarius sp.]MCY4316384.1 extracellular solute-binding protein [Roseovarius sp.]